MNPPFKIWKFIFPFMIEIFRVKSIKSSKLFVNSDFIFIKLKKYNISRNITPDNLLFEKAQLPLSRLMNEF